jgi:hypothetical protein
MKMAPVAVNISVEKLEDNQDGLTPHIYALLYDAKLTKFVEGRGNCRQCGKLGVGQFETLCKCLRWMVLDERMLVGL